MKDLVTTIQQLLTQLSDSQQETDTFPQQFSAHPITASSSSVQPVAPSDAGLYSCGWINDDGTMCIAPISKFTVPVPLITHSIANMTRVRPIECRWQGCGKKLLKRESIVRHVRERHLQQRRGPN